MPESTIEEVRKYIGLPLLMREILLLNLERPWVIEPLVGLGDRVIVVGPAKVGKTLLVTQVITHVSLGLPIFGYKTVPRRVLYSDFEMGLFTVNDRMKILARSYPQALDTLRVQVRPGSLEGAIDLIGKHWGQWPELWVVDPAIALGYSNENDNAVVWRRLDLLQKYADDMGGPALILVHHAGKPMRVKDAQQYEGIDISRGASAFGGWMDTQLSLMGRINDPHSVLHIWSRIAPPQDTISLIRDEDTLLYHVVNSKEAGREALQAVVTQVHLELGDVPQTHVVKEVARRLGVSARTVYRRMEGDEAGSEIGG